MEIIFAIVLGVVLGAFIGFVVARGKNKEQQNITDKLRWQLENEKSNAELMSQSLQQQIANTKSEAREQIGTTGAL